jgi:hypothetical protein
MSFYQLWDSFDAVKDEWTENRSLLESYTELVRLRSELEKSVIKRLEKIIQLPIFKLGKNTLLPLIEKMQSFYSSKLISSKNFITALNSEILLPLKDLMHSQEIKIKDHSEACKKLEAEKKKLQKTLEITKEKYWKQCKENSNKSKAEPNHKESACLEKYLQSIETFNRFQMIFTEEMGKNLAVFQITEEERLKHFRESLRKFIEAESGLINSPLAEAESLPIVNFNQAVNVFNPITELSKFIDDTKTDKPVQLFSFEPSPFGSSCHVPESRSSPEDLFMQKIIIKCWEGINLTENELKTFESSVSTSEGRKSWLYFLNERRIKSQFLIPVTGFSIMNKLLATLLNHIASQQDENSAKLTIVLSQTFYCEKTGEKVYLHLAVGQHQIWTQENIWTSMIESGIQCEMQNYALFCSDETSEEHKERMSAILASQLSSYVHIMKSFNMTEGFIREVAGKLIEKYKIKEMKVEDFIS